MRASRDWRLVRSVEYSLTAVSSSLNFPALLCVSVAAVCLSCAAHASASSSPRAPTRVARKRSTALTALGVQYAAARSRKNSLLGGAEVGQVHVRIATADAQLRAVHSILAVVVAIDTDGTRRDICGWVRHDAVEVEDAALRADSCLF